MKFTVKAIRDEVAGVIIFCKTPLEQGISFEVA